MNDLYHHGILGQKWGIRRYQNPDGSLTTAGKRRYQKQLAKKIKRDFRKDLHTDPSYIQKAMDENPQIKKDVEEYSSLKKIYDDEYDEKKLSHELEKAVSRHREEIDKIIKEIGYDAPVRGYELARADIEEDYVTTHDESYKSFLKKRDKAGAEVREKGEKVCADILGKYADVNLTNILKENMNRNFVDRKVHAEEGSRPVIVGNKSVKSFSRSNMKKR